MALILLLWLQLGQLMPQPGPPPPPGAPKPEAPSLSFTTQFVDSNSALELTWANTGRSGLYVGMGRLAGRTALMNLTFHRDGGDKVLNHSEPGVIANRMEQFVLFLPPGGRFVHRIPTALLYDRKAGAPLSQGRENVTLVADFWHLPATQSDLRMLEFATAGIWTGRLSAKASLVRPGGARK